MTNSRANTFTKDLLSGMRQDGLSVVECCLIWGVTDSEYNKLLESSPTLQRAHEIGEMHCAAWWHSNYRELARKGNASAMAFGMKNIAKVGWMDKPDIKEDEKEPVRAITISVLPPRVGEASD